MCHVGEAQIHFASGREGSKSTKEQKKPPKTKNQQGNPALAEPTTSPISDSTEELLTANYSLCLLTFLKVEVVVIIY